MKLQRCIWASFAAILLLGSVAGLDALAFGRHSVYYSPGVNYYHSPGPIGVGSVLPTYAPGVNYGWTNPIYPFPTARHPYIGPYPFYGVLPPPIATMDMYGYYPYGGTRRIAEDYGHSRDSFDTTPRKRPATYPAASLEEPLGDLRCVTFEILVPREDAVVFFDGFETKQTGLNRKFRTPAMKEDVLFTSTIEVRWTDGAGKLQARKEERKFVAGETIMLTIK